MYVIKSHQDNSFYEGQEMLGCVQGEAYSFQIEDAKVFDTIEEAQTAQAKLFDRNTEIVPISF